MNMERRLIVIDTNCLLQMLGKHSSYHALWKAFLEKRYVLCISNEILHEYEEIVTQKVSERVADLLIQTIMNSSNTLKKDPYFRFRLIEQDWDDNKFVDCAINCGADYIVSEDAHFRCLDTIPFPTVRVIRLEQFMKEMT